MFKDHHYLNDTINRVARCYIAMWGDRVVGFIATIAQPSTIKNAWRGHRAVVLPEFQGIGLGVRMIDIVAQIHIEQGHRFFSRTAHPRMGYYLEKSPLWKATTKNKKLRKDVTIESLYKNHYVDNKRICFSHEYIGQTIF